MTCDRIQYEVSQAIDEHHDLAIFEAHLSVCSDCSHFAAAAVGIAGCYRRRVTQGIDRLRRGTSPARVKRSRAGWLIPLAAALSVLLSVPLRPAPSLPALSTAAARVSLFDDIGLDSVDLRVLAWSGEPPLPRRLDQDLPSSISPEVDPSVLLPPNLRF
jgi:hypothetical protein